MRLVKARNKTPQAKPAEPVGGGLTRDEDDELRRLHYFSQLGALAGQKLERVLELRVNDRRKAVRAPREFDDSDQPRAEAKVERQPSGRPHPNFWLRRTPEPPD